MAQTIPSFGFYQLENLHRQQAKFMMVALIPSVASQVASTSVAPPTHPLLRLDLVTEPAAASSNIQQKFTEAQYPNWWPVVLISQDGALDRDVQTKLETLGFVNVFSYQGGWDSLIRQASASDNASDR
jgi:hypothetical protein